MIKGFKELFILLLLTFCISSVTQAAVVRGAVGVTENTFGEWSPQHVMANAIDQSGLSVGYISGVTDWDGYFGTLPSHEYSAVGHEWWGSSDAGLTGSVTFDLGGVYTLDKIALWNEEYLGISQFDVSTSINGTLFSLVGDDLSPTNNVQSLDYRADIFSLSESLAQFVKLDILSTGDNGYNTVSMGEIAFSTDTAPVPEPSTWLLLGTGLAGLAYYRRKKS